jgi:pantoate--beta-alanine ligase
MAKRPLIVRTLPALRRALSAVKSNDIALVPTMGALHAGHIALVRQARRRARHVVVSIFVNPAQFAPTEDLGSYPKTWKADIATLAAEKATLVWAPTAATMYPDGFATRIEPAGPAKAGLEDKFRPHFFGGVATVVTKLFTQVGAGFAMFGEKDYQQLCMVTQLVRDLDLPLKIVPVPTVREKDGLALSSRNVYLSPEERARAVALPRALEAARDSIRAGGEVSEALHIAKHSLDRASFSRIDYVALVDALSLEPLDRPAGDMRLIAAAKIGSTRLIDNLPV